MQLHERPRFFELLQRGGEARGWQAPGEGESARKRPFMARSELSSREDTSVLRATLGPW